MTNKKAKTLRTMLAIVLFYILLFVLEQVVPSSSILFLSLIHI